MTRDGEFDMFRVVTMLVPMIIAIFVTINYIFPMLRGAAEDLNNPDSNLSCAEHASRMGGTVQELNYADGCWIMKDGALFEVE